MDFALMRALAHPLTDDLQQRTIPVVQPAAGAQWSFTVPGGVVWVVRAIGATLTTSAVAGTRTVGVEVTDGNVGVAGAVHSRTLAASLTQRFYWMTEYSASPAGAAGGIASDSYPIMPMPAGWTLTSKAAAFDVGDQWSNVQLLVTQLYARPRGSYDIQRDTDIMAVAETSPYLGG